MIVPPGPVAVQVHDDGCPTHAALAVSVTCPDVGKLRLLTVYPPAEAVQLKLTDVALVLDQVLVYCPHATSVVGLRVAENVGGAGSLMVKFARPDTLYPVASSASA
ncbi:hypothetical protein KSF73_16865 [Burkholderiaceae bacterium DAT-1]|nr:hypothetical protein [Burkholderiaceae bacterium DAT-1]